ncbi:MULTISPECIES: CheR family methyltransferase [unclassified Carboxylicivirga]|uniref:CheR family methyltransferase n=1 Tax=Carboxylicivirga TaxID=1628153 RepID=UPI003D3569B6
MAVSFSISELREIAERLSSELDMPFQHMTHSFLKRRLSAYFDSCAIRKPDQLFEHLQDDQSLDAFKRFFTVNTTELFRDASFWRQLRKIMREKYSSQALHIWFPEVSTGEELYSLLILMDELGLMDSAQITVNHSSQAALDTLKEGLLSNKKNDVNAYNYKRFEGEYTLDKYFEERDGARYLNKALLRSVTFVQAGLNNVPAAKCNIVILRNSLIYYTRDYHLLLRDIIDGVLTRGGYLCLGVKEQLPAPFDTRFECIDSKEKIYSKYSFLKD